MDPNTKKALGLGPDAVKRSCLKKVQVGRRWLELVQSIGWVIAVFADWTKATWFSEKPEKEWRKVRRALISHRHWIRERVREILGPDHEWMMIAENCTANSSNCLNSR